MDPKKEIIIFKKQAILSICLFLFVNIGFAQVIPTTQTLPSAPTQTMNPVPGTYPVNLPLNYVRTFDAEMPFQVDTPLYSAYSTIQQVKQNTQYLDGLGRSLQRVIKDISPDGFDMVSPVVYDAY